MPFVSYDALPDPAYVLGPDSILRHANAQACEMLGYTLEELRGRHASALVDMALAARMARIVQWLFRRHARTLRVEHRIHHKDGTWLVVEASMRCHAPATGEPVLVVTHRNVTPHTHLDSALSRVRNRFATLFELAPVGLALNDEQRRIVAVNGSLARMLGYPAEALIGRRFEEITHPDDVATTTRLAAALRRREIPSFQARKRYIRGDGSVIWANVHVTAISPTIGGGVYSLGIAEDITDFKTEEAMLRQRMTEQRSALIRETHHRIKNNLQGVVGLLNDQAELSPEAAAPLRTAINRVQAIALVHGLFASPGLGALNICDVTVGIGRAMQDQFGRPIRVSVSGSEAPVRLDQEEMVPFALILLEFVSNAVKHCPRSDDPIDITVTRRAGEATVEVVNPRGALPAGFDLHRGLGVGTGLSLVKSLLPARGMDIGVHERSGGGVVARINVQPSLITAE